MADEPQVVKLLVVAVEEKSGTNSKGNDWKLFKAAFKGTKNKGTTFSTEAAPVLTKLRDEKAEAVFTMHLTNADYNEYEIDKIMSADGKTLLYEPKSKGKGRGGGGGGYNNRPDWSYETQEERRETRLSIEAQKALEYAIRTLEAVIQFDEMTRGDAVAFVQETQAGYRELLRASVETGSGSASRSVGAGGPKGSRSSGAGHSPDPQPAASRLEGLPSAGSDPASTDGQTKAVKVPN